ncbi:hypothetical protein H4R99_004701 [Coemansia sp. RSA 1722]|nr:hypothetical protein IWW45_008673 [Coemansia sp. RSA 485]KAJ2596955.1 hypothetical protein H4R99_004701 [Coemansia sp. RSA 1722]KAJ2637625.1 hypothetical protein GGF40_002234 [Coemansia sp. RSA 1286]
MAVSDGNTVSITYDLAQYSYLDAWVSKPETYLERYFTQRFYCAPISAKRKYDEAAAEEDADKELDSITERPKEWQYVYMAPNNHPLLDPVLRKDAGNITKIEFSDSIRKSVIKGKGKKQALRLMPDTKICTIYTDTDKEYTLRAAVKGLLMEWNAKIEQDAHLVYKNPAQAFLIIVNPLTDDDSKIFSECVSVTQSD